MAYRAGLRWRAIVVLFMLLGFSGCTNPFNPHESTVSVGSRPDYPMFHDPTQVDMDEHILVVVVQTTKERFGVSPEPCSDLYVLDLENATVTFTRDRYSDGHLDQFSRFDVLVLERVFEEGVGCYSQQEAMQLWFSSDPPADQVTRLLGVAEVPYHELTVHADLTVEFAGKTIEPGEEVLIDWKWKYPRKGFPPIRKWGNAEVFLAGAASRDQLHLMP